MTGYLLDTNVVSETRKTRSDARVIAFLSAAGSNELFLSVLTLGELRKGVALKRRTEPEAATEAQRLGRGHRNQLHGPGFTHRFSDRIALGRIVGRPKPSRH